MQSPACRMKRLRIKYSLTKIYFGCGTGMNMYMTRQDDAGNQWIKDLEITEPQRYPAEVSLGFGRVLCLMENEDVPGMYTYQRSQALSRLDLDMAY